MKELVTMESMYRCTSPPLFCYSSHHFHCHVISFTMSYLLSSTISFPFLLFSFSSLSFFSSWKLLAVCFFPVIFSRCCSWCNDYLWLPCYYFHLYSSHSSPSSLFSLYSLLFVFFSYLWAVTMGAFRYSFCSHPCVILFILTIHCHIYHYSCYLVFINVLGKWGISVLGLNLWVFEAHLYMCMFPHL